MAEVKPADEPGAAHDHVSETDTAPVLPATKVPAYEHEAPVPPRFAKVKLPLSPLRLALRAEAGCGFHLIRDLVLVVTGQFGSTSGVLSY